MACSDWLFILVVMVMTSSTREQSTCPQGLTTDQPGVARGTDAAMPWRTFYLSNCSVPQPPPGVGYLGRGFDVYHGNLLSTDGDTGFRMPVIHLSYRSRTMTSDHRYLLPDDTDLLYVTTARSDDVTEVHTRTDLLRMINQRIQLQSLDLQDGRYMASHDYTDFRSADSTALYQVEDLPLYSLSFVSKGQAASKSFQDDVHLLPPTCRDEDLPHYINLFRKYGTHVVSHVVLGKMAVRHVTLASKQIITAKLQKQTIEKIFKDALNISSLNSQLDDSQTVPLEVHLERIDNFFTTRFLGRDNPGLASKRQCLPRALSVYCHSLTTSACNLQPKSNMSNVIRYGDNITLNIGNDGSLFIDENISVIGTGTGFLLQQGKTSLPSQKKTMQILPLRGQENRIGEMLFPGDVFTLAPEKGERSRVQLAWTSNLGLSQNSLTSSPLYFQDVRHSLGLKEKGQLFVRENKGQPHLLTITNAGLTDAGPWSLTVETDHSLVSVVIDPCRHLCYPAGMVRAVVILPPGEGGVRKVQLSALPSLIDIPTRPGSWSMEVLQLTNLVTLTKYSVGSVTLSYPCSPCPSREWSLYGRSRLRVNKHNASAITASVDAEFYFQSPGTPEGAVISPSPVQLSLKGYTPVYNTTPAGPPLNCADRPCHNGGQCVPQGQGAVCECPQVWTGHTCNIPCFAELFAARANVTTPLSHIANIVFGSSGQASRTSLQWDFSTNPTPQQASPDFVFLLLPMVARVTAISAPPSLPLRQIDIEYFDVKGQIWAGVVVLKAANNVDHNYYVSEPSEVVTDRLRLMYRGRGAASLDLSDLVIFGCAMPSQLPMEDYVDKLLTASYQITRITTGNTQPPIPSLQNVLTDTFQSIYVTEQLQFQIPLDPSQACILDKRSVKWSVAQQLDLCPSHIEVTNLTVTSEDPGGGHGSQRTAYIDLTLSGEQDLIHPARAKAIRLSNSGNLTLECPGGSAHPGGGSGQSGGVVVDTGGLSDRLDTLERRTSILLGVVLFLLVLCFVVFVVFLVIMSRRYRDIRNELTTIRKLKMQKRIAKRQELQPQYASSHHAFTLPRPNSVSSNTTTSIPGRSNGQTARPLRYSQSLHGLQDRPRLTAAPGRSPGGGPASLDPANYIISNPMRTPSPVGTKSGEESDTVQSVC